MLILSLLIGCVPDAQEFSDIAEESAVCFTVAHEEIVAVGMDSGAVVPLREAPRRLDGRQIHALARLDHHLYWCARGPAHGLSRIDLITGEVDHSGRRCEAVTDVGGGLILVEPVYTTTEAGVAHAMSWYASWDAVVAGEADLVPADSRGSRVGRQAGQLFTAWHATDTLEGFDPVTGDALGEVHLEDHDTWVQGISGVGERLFVLDDGREGPGAWNPRIAEFDRTGAAVWEVYFGEEARAGGLTCSSSLDPNTFVADEPALGAGPDREALEPALEL